MSGQHGLRLRCPTWGHLENFYQSKVKDGNVLLARVPFSPSIGSLVLIALELPDGVVVDIEAKVQGLRRAPDGKKSAIRMILVDMDEIRPRLACAVAQGRQDGEHVEQSMLAAVPLPRTNTGLPVPIPSDAPIDEVVPRVVLPRAEEVGEEVRELYKELETALAAMREKSVIDVLGVSKDAQVSEIRLAYFALIKKYHPDVLCKHRSEAVTLLGSEIFVYINKAYDRLRDSAVASGKAIAAGPALLPSSGWIANFGDIGVVRAHASDQIADFSAPVPVPVKAMSSLAMNAPAIQANVQVKFSAGPRDEKREEGRLEKESLFVDARTTESGMRPLGSPAPIVGPSAQPYVQEEVNLPMLLDEAYEALAAQAYDEARENLAKFLEFAPRNREARALYHVAYGHTLIGREKEAAARTQFEVALKHDPKCRAAIDAKRGRAPSAGRRRRSTLLQRLFRR